VGGLRMLNRRGFLSFLGAAAVLDPERLLWVQGARTISIPHAKIWEARIECVRPELPALMLQSSALWKRIADSDPVGDFRPFGMRPYRIPIQPRIGGDFISTVS
jgi:hypothetical protein